MAATYALILHTPEGVVQSMNSGEGFLILGSAPSCSIRIDDPSVAPEHARVILRETEIEVENLTQGKVTEVNGVQIHEKTVAEIPASVQIGDTVLLVEMAPSEEPASNAPPKGDSITPEPPSEPGQPAFLTLSSFLKPSEGEELPPMRMDILGSAEIKGEYILTREIARGGMGQIYEGEDSQLKRKVAVKVSSKSIRGDDPRFTKEVEVLALLAHPNIVPIHSAGSDEFGRPFYSMKLVKGRSLQEILNHLQEGNAEDKQHFTRERLLNVFQKVCDAMAFAHSKGILHRDLKPDNVMVGEFGEVLVMDWGLAKIKGEKESVPLPVAEIETKNFGMTLEGEVVGTPQYMSPEQAEGMVNELDERADIYSLGAILYSLLTLRAPVDGESLEEVLTKVKRGEITPVETKVSGVKTASTSATALKNMAATTIIGEGVPLELAAVVRKAMAKERADRYQTVEDFAEDIESYLHGFATRAEQAGLLRQFWLLIRRHKAISAMATMLFLAGPLFTLQLAASERRAKEQAIQAEKNARSAAASEERAHIQEQNALAEKEAARRSAARAQIALAEAAEKDFDGDSMQLALSEVPENLRDQNWQYLNRRLNSSAKVITAKELSPYLHVTPYLLKKNTYLTVQQNAWVRLLDSQNGNTEDLFRLESTAIGSSAMSRDGKRLAVCRNGSLAKQTDPYVIEIRSLPGGEKIQTIPSPLPTKRVALSPDGKLLFCEVHQEENQIRVSETDTGRLLWTGGAKGIVRTELAENGKFIRLLSRDEGLVELDTKTGTLIRTLGKPTFNTYGLHYFSPSGAMYEAYGPTFRKVEIESTRTQFERRLACAIPTGITSITEAKGIFTLSRRSESCAILQIWDSSGGLIRSAFYEGGQGLWAVVAHPQNGEIAVVHGTRIKIWKESDLTKPTLTLSSAYSLVDATFLSAPGVLMRISDTLTEGRKLEMLDTHLPNSEETPKFTAPISDREQHTFSRDLKTVAINDGDHRRGIKVFRINGASLSPVAEWIAPELGTGFALNQDGSRLWFANGIFETQTGKPLAKLDRSNVGPVYTASCVWVAEDRVLAIGNVVDSTSEEAEETSSRVLALWDATTGALLQKVSAPTIKSISVSPDGTKIVESGADFRMRIRNAQTLQVEADYRTHDGELTDAQWHPTLPLIVTTGYDSKTRIWDSRNGRLLEEIRALNRPPVKLMLSADGTTLGTQSSQLIRTYEPRTFKVEPK
ncbi:MAG: protein kinase [Verrucomicrobiota bacterium]